MRISLFQKLFVALLLSSTLVIATMAVLVNSSFKEGFQQYLNQEELTKAKTLAARVSDYYSETYGWHRLEVAPHIWAGLLQQLGEAPPPRDKRRPTGALLPKQSIMAPLSVRLNLLDADGNVLLGPPDNLNSIDGMNSVTLDITKNGQVIGYVTVVQSESLTNSLAESFLHSQTKHIITISFATIMLSLLFAVVCVRYLLTPLRALHQGANAVRDGNLDYQIEHRNNDEIADVISAFNLLVKSLKNQEELRERWLSDISHELRTPLAVLRGELEALQDGIRKPEPTYIESLHQQVLTLIQLVEDLRSTSKAEIQLQINLQKVSIKDVVENALASHINRFESKNLDLSCDLHPCDAFIQGDKQKLTQVLNNLLENSYRYTDEGGEVHIHTSQYDNNVLIIVEDSAPGVPNEALPKLFERLYRVDQSRSREFGGSGLGLSICQGIIQAHAGTAQVEKSQLGGLKVTIQLPLT